MSDNMRFVYQACAVELKGLIGIQVVPVEADVFGVLFSYYVGNQVLLRPYTKRKATQIAVAAIVAWDKSAQS